MAARAPEGQRICVARLGAAHGVRGEVKLWSFTADPSAVADYGPFDTADGRELGTVVAVQNFGAGDLLELRAAGESQTVLLPFTTATVPVVDIAGGRIVIDPPENLFKGR